jgi:hypothetical protein
MRTILIVASVVVLLGACKKDKWEQAVSDLEGFRDKMCACKDKSGDRAARKICADDVETAMKTWDKGMEDKMGKDDKPPEKLMERGDKVQKELRDCKKAIRHDADALEGEAAMAKMSEYKDKMCACKSGDKACAEAVQKDMQSYAAAHTDMATMKMSDEDMKKATNIGMELAKCSSKAMAIDAAAGSAAP